MTEVCSFAGRASRVAVLVPKVASMFSSESTPSPRFKKVVLAVLVCMFLFATASIVFKHFVFLTHGYDTGIEGGVARSIIFDQSFYDNVKNENLLGDHFQPALAIPGLFFKLWDNAAVVLIFQSLCVFASIVLAYFLAKRVLKNEMKAILLTSVFAFNYYLHAANRYEFHIEFLGLVLLFVILLLIEREASSRKHRALLLLVAISILFVKEDLALVIGVFGLWLVVFRRAKRREGLTLFVTGIGGFLVLEAWVIPHFADGEHHYLSRYSNLGSTPGEIARVLFTRPDIVIANLVSPVEKIGLLLLLLGSFLFLPLLAPVVLLAGFAGLFYNMISGYEYQYAFRVQYAIPVLPFLFYASLYGFKRLEAHADKWRSRFRPIGKLVFGCIVAGILLLALAFILAYARPFLQHNDIAVYHALSQNVRPMIPRESRILTNNELQPHFLDYQYAGVLSLDSQTSDFERVDFVVMFVDRTPSQWDKASHQQYVGRLREDFGTVYEDKHFLVLRTR